MNSTSALLGTNILLFHQEPVSSCKIGTIPIVLTFLNIKSNRMKKIILFSLLLTTVLMSQATVISRYNAGHKPGFKIEKSTLESSSKTETIKSPIKVNSAESCTVTMKGSISGGVFSVEVSCSATASTCDQATSKATSCLTAAIRRARQNLS